MSTQPEAMCRVANNTKEKTMKIKTKENNNMLKLFTTELHGAEWPDHADVDALVELPDDVTQEEIDDIMFEIGFDHHWQCLEETNDFRTKEAAFFPFYDLTYLEHIDVYERDEYGSLVCNRTPLETWQRHIQPLTERLAERLIHPPIQPPRFGEDGFTDPPFGDDTISFEAARQIFEEEIKLFYDWEFSAIEEKSYRTNGGWYFINAGGMDGTIDDVTVLTIYGENPNETAQFFTKVDVGERRAPRVLSFEEQVDQIANGRLYDQYDLHDLDGLDDLAHLGDVDLGCREAIRQKRIEVYRSIPEFEVAWRKHVSMKLLNSFLYDNWFISDEELDGHIFERNRYIREIDVLIRGISDQRTQALLRNVFSFLDGRTVLFETEKHGRRSGRRA